MLQIAHCRALDQGGGVMLDNLRDSGSITRGALYNTTIFNCSATFSGGGLLATDLLDISSPRPTVVILDCLSLSQHSRLPPPSGFLRDSYEDRPQLNHHKPQSLRCVPLGSSARRAARQPHNLRVPFCQQHGGGYWRWRACHRLVDIHGHYQASK